MIERVIGKEVETFIKGYHELTGTPMKAIREYVKNNSPVNLIERPMVIEHNDIQMKKINTLNDFITSYGVLKVKEENEKIKITSHEKAGKYFISLLSGIVDYECFLVAFLDNKNFIIETKIVSKGDTKNVAVYPKAILKAAIANNCNCMIIAHNHPSGSTEVSNDDLNLTRRLETIFNPLEINVLDHIIVGGKKYVSMSKEGLLNNYFVKKLNYEPIIMKSIEEVEV